jgi:hypothetical protein
MDVLSIFICIALGEVIKDVVISLLVVTVLVMTVLVLVVSFGQRSFFK